MPLLSSAMVDRIARRPGGLLGYLFYRFPFGHRAGFDLALEHVPPKAGDTVLEVGCGGGVFLRRVMASGCHAVGIDHSPDMISGTARLNRRSVKEGRLALHQADAASLPLPDSFADKVFCLNAFFFFPEPEKSLREMARVLKPGGTLALVTAPPEFEAQIARFSRSMAASMRFDTPETLAAWAKGVGLAAVETTQVPGAGILLIASKEAEHG